MKKFAAMLMLVCGLGMFGIVGCESGEKKPTVPTNPPAKTDGKTDTGKMEKETPPTTPTTPEKGK